MNARTCIVDRSELPADQLIRFVADPDDLVVPDIAGKLPGRGVWVTCSRQKVEEAVKRNLFARGLKHKVGVDPALADQVAGLLGEAALSSLGLAKKAGAVVIGFERAERALQEANVAMLVHSAEASADSRSKLAWLAGETQTGSGNGEFPVFAAWQGETLDRRLGVQNVAHLAVLEAPASRGFLAAVRRYRNYIGPQGA